jgi:hypothetical protein
MDNPTLVWAASGAAILMGVHLLAERFHALVGPRKGGVNSVLTGITSAYLFLQVLPVIGVPEGVPGALEVGSARYSPRMAFGLAFLGFVVFYAAEVWAHRAPTDGASSGKNPQVYRLLLVGLALFNAGIAFLLPCKVATGGPWVAATYVLAMGVHLLVLDHALADVHGGRYGRSARTIHSAGLACGLLLWISPHGGDGAGDGGRRDLADPRQEPGGGHGS